MQTLLHQFREFASNQKGRYEYASPDYCACAQFTKHLGIFHDYRYKYLNADYRNVRERNNFENRFGPLERLASREGAHTWEALTQRIDRYIKRTEELGEEQPKRPRQDNNWFIWTPNSGAEPLDSMPVYHTHTITLDRMRMTSNLAKIFEDLDKELELA